MKNKFIFTCLLILTTNCSANPWPPTVSFNETKCYSTTGENLVGCFQNNSDWDLSNYQLMMTTVFNDGSYDEHLFSIKPMQTGSYAVISTSSAEMKDDVISAEWFSIVIGGASRHKVIPGCTIEVTPTRVSKSVVSVGRLGWQLYCKD